MVSWCLSVADMAAIRAFDARSNPSGKGAPVGFAEYGAAPLPGQILALYPVAASMKSADSSSVQHGRQEMTSVRHDVSHTECMPNTQASISVRTCTCASMQMFQVGRAS